MCFSIGLPKTIDFLFVPNGKLMFLGVPIFKPIYVHIIRLIAVLLNVSATGNINF